MKKFLLMIMCALAALLSTKSLFAQENATNQETNAAVEENAVTNEIENAADADSDEYYGEDQAQEPAEEAAANEEMTAPVEVPAVPAVEAVKPAEVVPAVAAPSAVKEAVNFGDFRSSTLTTKAWGALNNNDIESVLAYTNKCIELYAEKARAMQSDLKEYPTGTNDEIFKFWALNDVATSYYIQGEAYRKANMKDESKEAFNKLIKDYTFGQAFDPKGWFWKPAEAAKERLGMIEAGVNLDFGDNSSNQLVQKAWAALAAKDLNAVVAYVNKLTDLYSKDAKTMQASLKDYESSSKEKTMSYWALNDVGTGLFILGEAYRGAGKKEEAAQAYKKLIDEYFYAQCWDPEPHNWFWKPAEAAQQKMAEMDNV